MINGFIEVTERSGDKLLINTANIQMVSGSTIYLIFAEPGAETQDYVVVNEEYNTIKRLIQNATGGDRR